MITVSRLLKSWATPPASRPTASIFCACRSCSSSWRCSVMSAAVPTSDRPRRPRRRREGAIADPAHRAVGTDDAVDLVVVAAARPRVGGLLDPLAIVRVDGVHPHPGASSRISRGAAEIRLEGGAHVEQPAVRVGHPEHLLDGLGELAEPVLGDPPLLLGALPLALALVDADGEADVAGELLEQAALLVVEDARLVGVDVERAEGPPVAEQDRRTPPSSGSRGRALPSRQAPPRDRARCRRRPPAGPVSSARRVKAQPAGGSAPIETDR